MKVTRAELYEMVWKTPMSRLAREFGVSDVALAKTCVRLGVPRPGRGYWAQLAAGMKPRRPPLPKAAPDGRAEWTELARAPAGPPRAPRPARPPVEVPKNLRHADEVVRQLGALLADAPTDQHGRLLVGTKYSPVLAVTIDTHRRALLIIDAFSKALTSRGHALELDDEDARGPVKLCVRMELGAIGIAVAEVLDATEHVLTPAEKERVAEGFRYGIPKHDHAPSGRLQLALRGIYGHRTRWSDTRTRKLEGELGAVVLALEEEGGRRRAAREAEAARRAEQERQQRAAEEARRFREAEEARAKYEAAVKRDLQEMANAWAEADLIRGFLNACEAALPPDRRSDADAAWLAWAHAAADALDPLTRPATVAKSLRSPSGP